MYIVIIGCGRIGSLLAMDLSNEGHDVVIIDNDRLKLDSLGSGFNGIRAKGVEFDNDVLSSAGLANADVFLAMTPDDNKNLVAAQVARQVFGVNRVIARVADPTKQFLYDQLGIETVCPTTNSAMMTKEMMMHEHYKLLCFVTEGVEIIEFEAEPQTDLTVLQINDKFMTKISCITRKGTSFIPRDTETIKSFDRVVCTVLTHKKNSLLKALGR